MNENKKNKATKEIRFSARTDEASYNAACERAEVLGCTLSAYINSCVNEKPSNLDRTATGKILFKTAVLLEELDKKNSKSDTAMIREEIKKLCILLNS